MEIKLTNSLLFSKGVITNLMRIFVLLFCTTVFSFSNGDLLSQNAKIKIDSEKTVSVDEVFNLIKSQTEYNFIYQVNLFKNSPKIHLKKGVIKANKLLNIALSKGSYAVSFDDKQTIVVTKKVIDNRIKQSSVLVKGIVKDQAGFPVPGVTVIYKEYPNQGTSTDFDGKYQILIQKGKKATLQFSSIGFLTQEVVVGNRTEVNIIFKEAVTSLDEVVLVGYGAKKRSEVSSAVSSVKASAITKNVGSNVSFDRGLTGLIKGVQVNQVSGRLGSSVDINIRGITSPFSGSNNNPLFVIDGVPFQTSPTASFTGEVQFNDNPNPLQTINPNDIVSIDVLKDASATAIYGSQGANGVVIVKTRRGKKNGKLTVAVSTTTTVAEPIKKLKYLNTAQYKARANEILKNTTDYIKANPGVIWSLGIFDDYSDMADLSYDFSTPFPWNINYNGLKDSYFGDADTQWADEVFRDPAVTNQYNVSINGGSKTTSYSTSIGHTNQEGLLLNEKLKQYNFRATVETELSEKITFGFTTSLGFTDNFSGYGNTDNNNLGSKFSYRPDHAPRDEFGNYTRDNQLLYGFYRVSNVNPLQELTENKIASETFSVLGNAFLEIEPIKDLKIRGSVNIGRFSVDGSSFKGASLNQQWLDFDPILSRLAESNSINTNVVSNITANYSKTINEDHNFTALLGATWNRTRNERSRVIYEGFPDEETLINASVANTVRGKGGAIIESGLNSIFSRVSYNYKQKYYLTANFRADESIKFGPNNRWGYFPSIAGSWDVTKESFLDEVDAINILRLRLGYGNSGQDNVANFAYKQFFTVAGRSEGLYNGNIAVSQGSTLPNLDIRWEKTVESNFGLDFGFLENRIRGSVDVYNRKTTDALMNTPFPLETGATSYTQNFATISNKGIEVDLSGDIIRTKDLTWSLGLNISKNKNTLDKFSEDGVPFYLSRFYEVGREVGMISGYVTEGIFSDQAELDRLNTAAGGVYQLATTGLGDYKYKDLNGDNKITTEDQEYIGSAQADFFGGFNSSIQYKDFELSTFFTFSVGGEAALDQDFTVLSSFNAKQNVPVRFLDTWSPTNLDAKYPRAIAGSFGINQNARRSSALLYDTSYLRLQALQLKYNLPISLIQKYSLSNVSVFVAGNNIWTSTKFPGVDPTLLGGGSSPFSSTGSRDPYPIAKTWSLGVNINF